MSTFTIDPDNNITALVEVPADADRSTTFSTEKELAKLIGEWPISGLIDACNSFAGVAPFQELKPKRTLTSSNTRSSLACVPIAFPRLHRETQFRCWPARSIRRDVPCGRSSPAERK